MSSEPGARNAVTVLAARGFETVVLTFNADSDWLTLTWLRVLGNDTPQTAAAIAKIVLRLDSGAISISEKTRRPRPRTVPASRRAHAGANDAKTSIVFAT